jgi:hypothetical protein
MLSWSASRNHLLLAHLQRTAFDLFPQHNIYPTAEEGFGTAVEFLQSRHGNTCWLCIIVSRGPESQARSR